LAQITPKPCLHPQFPGKIVHHKTPALPSPYSKKQKDDGSTASSKKAPSNEVMISVGACVSSDNKFNKLVKRKLHKIDSENSNLSQDLMKKTAVGNLINKTMVISPLPQILLDHITFCHGTSYLPNLQTSPSFIFNAKKKPVPINMMSIRALSNVHSHEPTASRMTQVSLRITIPSAQLPCPCVDSGELTNQDFPKKIMEAKLADNSIGGIVTVIKYCTTGLGKLCFDKLRASLAHAILSIAATKGFEIGSGIKGVKMAGSQQICLLKLTMACLLQPIVVVVFNAANNRQGAILDPDLLSTVQWKTNATINGWAQGSIA
ncbi:hypothetical protein MJO28_009994, partial [Puccinia striiformis f. sp. tritici]